MSKSTKDNNIDIPNDILRQLLTESEVRMLKNRWQIIQYLKEGLSIRKVAEKVRVGTDTVVRVTRLMERNNLGKILDREKKVKPIKTNTPWIFGKN